MKKPAQMYHASTNREVTEFQPKNEFPRYGSEENLVFGTAYKEVAAMFLVPRTISTVISKYDDECVVFVDCTKEEFDTEDKGGAIYALPSDTFNTNESIGMGNTEWVSKESVKPISKQVYATAIYALRENKVRIYFLAKDVFLKVQANPSCGREIAKEL